MKVTIKIFFLLFAISLAIGGVMVYAKTKVEPPMTIKQVDQYAEDIATSRKALVSVKNEVMEDSIFFTAIDRINVFNLENKIQSDRSDKYLDNCMNAYCSLFMNRCFSEFKKSVWNDNEHNNILSRVSVLKSLLHSDKSMALTKQETDSLNLITRVISDYRQARRISRSTVFSGVANAQSVISQANSFSNNGYLRNCTDLMSSLRNVKSEIATSHYNYVSTQVDKLSQYRYFSKTYYENTLIPHVDAVTTEYDNKAQSLYGSKRDVNALWQRARGFYDQAMSYYGNTETNN